jgi:hypothetical protein
MISVINEDDYVPIDTLRDKLSKFYYSPWDVVNARCEGEREITRKGMCPTDDGCYTFSPGWCSGLDGHCVNSCGRLDVIAPSEIELDKNNSYVHREITWDFFRDKLNDHATILDNSYEDESFVYYSISSDILNYESYVRANSDPIFVLYKRYKPYADSNGKFRYRLKCIFETKEKMDEYISRYG